MARTNRYAQECASCGGRVSKGAGVLERGDDGRWEVRHPGCAGIDPGELEAVGSARSTPERFDTDGTPLAMTRYGWRRGYEHTGHRCEDAPCCGCCD